MTEADAADRELLERLSKLDSCAISDALDTMGLAGAVVGITPLWGADKVIVGRARTVTVGPRAADRPAHHVGAAAIEASEDTDVLVFANDGRTDVSCFGGILTLAAVRRGVRGVVIDGACRDIAESEEHGFPVFGRAVVPVSARGRIVQLAMDEPIDFAGASVNARDLVIADRNGVVFILAGEALAVVAMAEKIAAREKRMVEAVLSGEPVTKVMHDSKFPTLEEGER